MKTLIWIVLIYLLPGQQVGEERLRRRAEADCRADHAEAQVTYRRGPGNLYGRIVPSLTALCFVPEPEPEQETEKTDV